MFFKTIWQRTNWIVLIISGIVIMLISVLSAYLWSDWATMNGLIICWLDNPIELITSGSFKLIIAPLFSILTVVVLKVYSSKNILINCASRSRYFILTVEALAQYVLIISFLLVSISSLMGKLIVSISVNWDQERSFFWVNNGFVMQKFSYEKVMPLGISIVISLLTISMVCKLLYDLFANLLLGVIFVITVSTLDVFSETRLYYNLVEFDYHCIAANQLFWKKIPYAIFLLLLLTTIDYFIVKKKITYNEGLRIL